MREDSILEKAKLIINNKMGNIIESFKNKDLLIEVTNSCNSSCIFCANYKMIREIGFIEEALLRGVLNDAYKLGVRKVGFYTTGEPLLNKNLSSYIKDAKNIGYEYIYITTNGILANVSLIEEFVSEGLSSIKFSINAISSQEYCIIHGVDCFDLVINNLCEVSKFKKSKKLNFKLGISYISTSLNNHSYNEISKYFQKFTNDISIIGVRNQSGLMPENYDIKNFKDEEKVLKGERNFPCYYPFNTICVTKEGYLTACCTDFENLLVYADLNKSSLFESWNNKTIQELRNSHLKGKVDGLLCDNCINGCSNHPKPLIQKYSTKEYKIYKDKDRLLKRKGTAI